MDLLVGRDRLRAERPTMESSNPKARNDVNRTENIRLIVKLIA